MISKPAPSRAFPMPVAWVQSDGTFKQPKNVILPIVPNELTEDRMKCGTKKPMPKGKGGKKK